MITFDAQEFLRIGAAIYDRRDQIESMADAAVARGFDNIVLCSVGGSQAMMDPFATIIRRLSSVPVVQVLAPLYTTGGHPEVTSRSLVIMASKSGDTTETVAAAKALQKLGAPIFSVVGVDGSPLQALSDWCFVYGDGRPQELVLYLFVGALLHRLGSFEAYPRFADQLRNLPAALVDVRQTFDARAIDYCERFNADPYNIWVASGELWPVAYAYAMCVLEESLWLRTKSVMSSEFFHGTLELVERDTCVTLLVGEGATRPLDLRVKDFIERYTDNAAVIDMADFALAGFDAEFRWMLGPVVANAALQRISKNMEHINQHPLETRRYYRKVAY